MSEQEAQHATSLLHDADYVKVDASHVVNLDKPATFVKILERFFRAG